MSKCQYITKKGKRCTRSAHNDTDACWQHTKAKNKTEKKDVPKPTAGTKNATPQEEKKSTGQSSSYFDYGNTKGQKSNYFGFSFNIPTKFATKPVYFTDNKGNRVQFFPVTMDELRAVETLNKYNIVDNKSWRTWLISNHPDKTQDQKEKKERQSLSSIVNMAADLIFKPRRETTF